MTVAMGTLSTRGWAKTPQDLLQSILDNYTEMGYSQSVLYQGNVKSLARTRAMYGDDPEELRSAVKKDLTSLCNNVFGAGIAQIEISTSFEENTSMVYRLILRLRIEIDGVVYDAINSASIEE